MNPTKTNDQRQIIPPYPCTYFWLTQSEFYLLPQFDGYDKIVL